MINIKDILVGGERILETINSVSVDSDEGYETTVTNRRVLFIKEGEKIEFTRDSISSESWETRRKYGIWLFFLGILTTLPSIFLFSGTIIAVILGMAGMIIIAIWFFFKKEYVSISQGNRIIRLEGDKVKLEKLLASVKVLKPFDLEKY